METAIIQEWLECHQRVSYVRARQDQDRNILLTVNICFRKEKTLKNSFSYVSHGNGCALFIKQVPRVLLKGGSDSKCKAKSKRRRLAEKKEKVFSEWKRSSAVIYILPWPNR